MLWFKTHSLVWHGFMELWTPSCGPALSTVWSLLNLYLQETGYLLHWESYRKYRLSNSDKIWLMQAHSKFKLNFSLSFLISPSFLIPASSHDTVWLSLAAYRHFDIIPMTFLWLPTHPPILCFFLFLSSLWHFLYLATFSIISIALQKSLQLYAQFNCAIQITWYRPHITKEINMLWEWPQKFQFQNNSHISSKKLYGTSVIIAF